jgi:hypothetical protein
VTNSSSSSFVIVGVSNDNTIEELLKAEKIDKPRCSYGISDGKVVNFYGDYDYVSYAGIDIEELMETMTLPQMKEQFVNQVKEKLNVDIPTYLVKLYYGEVGE